MFNSEQKKESLANLQKAAVDYKTAYDNAIYASCQLYETRKKSVDLIKSIVCFHDGVSNVPNELTDGVGKAKQNIEAFEANINAIQVELNKAAEQNNITIKDSNGGAGIAIGSTAAGIGIVVGGPAAAMAIATTFGVASTGVAIGSLSGAAATTAALAWLGGGAVAAGGAGMAGGSALLAALGPIGLGLAAIGLITGGLVLNGKNAKIAAEVNDKTLELNTATQGLQEKTAKINGLYNETVQSEMKMRYLFDGIFSEEKTYSGWKNEQQTKFGDMIKETEVLSNSILITV
jgi:hypothetical protein